MNPGDINKSLKNLTPLKKGDRIGKAASSDRLNSIQSIIRALCRGDNVVTGPHIRKKTQEGHFILIGEKGGKGGGGGEIRTPFLIISRTKPNTGELQLGVIHDSHLFNSEDRNTYEEENNDWGLLDVDEQTGWITVTTSDIGKKLWLEIELDEDDQSIIGIDLRYDFPGTTDAWTDFPDPVEIDESDPENVGQQFYHQIIGEISNPDIDPREGSMILTIPNSGGMRIQVNQLLFDNIFMTTATTTNDADDPGLPIIVNSSPYLPVTDTGGTGTPFPSEDDLMTPWQFGSQETLNDYNFELFNASEQGAAKVLVLDGVVYTANNEGADPSGMPSNDTFTLNVADGDEIWVGFTYENHLNYEITSCFIQAGQQTPDDDPPHNTAYVTIGNVSVDDSGDVPIVSCRNEVCGDIEWQPPRLDVHFDFQLEDASDGFSPLVRIYDGLILYPNGDTPLDGFFYPAGMPTATGSDYIIPVNDGDEIWVGIQWNFETDDGVSGEDIVSSWIQAGDHTPEDTGLITYITLGHVDVNFQADFVQVFPFNEQLGDIRITYPPSLDSDEVLQLSVDKDTGHVVWKTSKIAQVTAESTGFSGISDEVQLDDIDVLTFDSSDFSVWDGGGGQAVITNANVLSISCGSTLVESVNDISLDSDLFTLTDDGGGSVSIGLQTTDCS